jgi:hypothetical protein
MQQPVTLDREGVQAVANLIGDPDATVRKHAALFLAQLTGPSLESARAALKRVLADLSNQNGIYNGVVIIDAWLARKDAADTLGRDSLRTMLSGLSTDLTPPESWSQTRSVIDRAMARG